MAAPVCLRVPTDSDIGGSVTEARRGTYVHPDTDRPKLAATTVVPAPTRPVSMPPASTADDGEVTQAARLTSVPPTTQHLPSARVEVIREQGRARGFSWEVADRMARAQKQSTIAVYESKWRVYCAWCGERERDPLDTNVVMLADFLYSLRAEKRLAVSTIEGYRTAIASTLKGVTGTDLGKDADLSRLIANFAREVPKTRTSVPAWNLALVLNGLKKAPFEPLQETSLKLLTFKTVFLLAFASGKRRGELHALINDFRRTDNWDEITLFVESSFVAKTQLADSNASSQPLVIPALSKSPGCGSNEEEVLLCPVRALRHYIDRTAGLRENKKKLLVSFKKGFKGDIAKATVSHWIKKTVMLTYELAGEEDLTDLHVRAHDVRGFAASWARLANIALEDIMFSCSWHSHNTFTHFYLKDLAKIHQDLYALGPTVAVQHVIK
jgi:hypothetical protein